MRSIVLSVLILPMTGLAATELGDIELPPGFEIEVFADVPNARSLALGAEGTIFVSNRSKQSVYAVVPKAGEDPRVIEIASGEGDGLLADALAAAGLLDDEQPSAAVAGGAHRDRPLQPGDGSLQAN